MGCERRQTRPWKHVPLTQISPKVVYLMHMKTSKEPFSNIPNRTQVKQRTSSPKHSNHSNAPPPPPPPRLNTFPFIILHLANYQARFITLFYLDNEGMHLVKTCGNDVVLSSVLLRSVLSSTKKTVLFSREYRRNTGHFLPRRSWTE